MEFKRNSSRSSIRTPSVFAIKKRKNRYDQLESTNDAEGEMMGGESNSHYVTLVNQSDDENRNAFENINFFHPVSTEEEEVKKRKTPPPIPARRQSHHSSISSAERLIPPPPLPIPAPPRRDSRKGRKRPNFLEKPNTMGAQIFPTETMQTRHLSTSLTLDSISTAEPRLIRTSVSHDFDTKSTNPGESSDEGATLLPRVELSKDDLSDFEIIDLVLKDDDEKDELEKRNIKGSTNNLADFDDECLAEKIEQVTLKADTEEEKSLPDYLAEHAEQQQQQLADKQDKQTEKLLKLSNDATHGALVKLPKNRRQRLRGRNHWAPVALSLTPSGLSIHAEDSGRVIETIPYYTDVQLSAIATDQQNSTKVVYYVKLLKVTYKPKRATNSSSSREYTEYLSHNSPFAPFVSRIRPLVKIGARDYAQIKDIARSIVSMLGQTDKISEETNLLTPSPYCRVVIDVFDDTTCSLDSNGVLQSSIVETSIRILSFGSDKILLALNDNQADVSSFEDVDRYQTKSTIEPLNIRTHSMVNGEYEKHRLLRLNNPINGAKFELVRFQTKLGNQTMPLTLKTEYTLFGSSCSITSSLHLNAKEKIKNLKIRFPILQSWREALRADTAFTSITSGTYTIESDALVWRLGSVSAVDAKQEFMSVKFDPGPMTIMRTHIKSCLLEFELDDTRLSRTEVAALSAKSPSLDIDRIITNRSYYSLRVGIHFTP